MPLRMVLDPSLVLYDGGHWLAQEPHCRLRFAALALHRSQSREFGLPIVLSDELIDLMYLHFPYGEEFRNIPELRDLRAVIGELRQRAAVVSPAQEPGIISIRPGDAVGRYVENADSLEAWNRLLSECISRRAGGEFDFSVATWGEAPPFLSIELTANAPAVVAEIPCVGDEGSWIKLLSSLDWWPDLPRAVYFCFMTNAGINRHRSARNEPLPFRVTDAFTRSLTAHCQERHLREALIEALTKKVYGVLDGGLHDELLRGRRSEIRRFRVTDFWRVHYRQNDGGIVLDEFGPHDIGGVG